VTGTIINAAAIVLGGLAGLCMRRGIPPATQNWLKVALGALTVILGLRLTWISLNGPILTFFKQLGIVVLAMMLGKITGRLLRLQRGSNRLGQFARERCAAARPGSRGQFNDAFTVCALLFCVAPLGPLGAVADGLGGHYGPLIVKAVMDGLAAMGFVSLFGWGVLVSALPVLAFQGTISLLCLQYAEPFLRIHGGLADAVLATAGLLIFSVALLIFEARRVEVADYLPSLAFAPLLAWFWW
jgi:uncharacterized membrane protein YqgA involved in biofilm formation